MKSKGWSAENVAFGTGGSLLQRIDRDTQKCAFKCSHVIIDGADVSQYFLIGLFDMHILYYVVFLANKIHH